MCAIVRIAWCALVAGGRIGAVAPAITPTTGAITDSIPNSGIARARVHSNGLPGASPAHDEAAGLTLGPPVAAADSPPYPSRPGHAGLRARLGRRRGIPHPHRPLVAQPHSPTDRPRR